MHMKTVSEEVVILRKRGKTYREICIKLGKEIPRSTLSYWCKNVSLPRSYQEKLRKLNKKSRTKALVTRRSIKKAVQDTLWQRNKSLIDKYEDEIDMKKIALAALYLGEGSKKGHRGLALGSSDPKIIKIYIRLLRDVYGIGINKLRARISYRADQDIADLHRFWSKVSNIPVSSFYITKPDPRTIGKVTKSKNYKGTCAVYCAGTTHQLELEAVAEMMAKGR